MPQPQIFTADQVVSLRKSGVILRDCLTYLTGLVKPGMTTKQVDMFAEEFIRDRGGKPAFKGYHGFPATLCVSINEECVHGIPGKRVIKDGDIVSLDCGVIYEEMFTDACVTVPMGPVSAEATKLLRVTKEALDAAVAMIKGGIRVGDISATVQRVVEKGGFSCVAALTGHGVGGAVHQFPDIPNVGKAGTGPVLPAGTVIAVEPIVSAGSDEVRTLEDGWTLVEVDGALTAHFEHTLYLTANGCEVIA